MLYCRLRSWGGGGGVLDGSGLALDQTPSSECPSSCCARAIVYYYTLNIIAMHPFYCMGSPRVTVS